MCVYVTVSTDTTFRMTMRVKVIVGDLERVKGRLTWQLGFGEKEKTGKEVTKRVSREEKLMLR